MPRARSPPPPHVLALCYPSQERRVVFVRKECTGVLYDLLEWAANKQSGLHQLDFSTGFLQRQENPNIPALRDR